MDPVEHVLFEIVKELPPPEVAEQVRAVVFYVEVSGLALAALDAEFAHWGVCPLEVVSGKTIGKRYRPHDPQLCCSN